MVLSITNLKGGCGKSTLSINIASAFAQSGIKAAIIDADTNQSCLKWSALRGHDMPPVPVFGCPDNDALVTAVTAAKKIADVVIIDGIPSLDIQNSKLLLIADFLLIPLLPGQFDMWATEKFVDHYLKAVRIKGKPIPASFVLNQYKKTTTAREVLQALEKVEDLIPTFENHIKSRIVYSKSIESGKGAVESIDAKAKQEMKRFINELNDRLNQIAN